MGAPSQPDAGYDLDTLVNDVRVVLDSLGIRRATLVGHSFGASEAARFASLWPERVSAVMNIDGLTVVDGEAFMDAMAATPGPPPAGDADRVSVAAFGDYIGRVYGVPLPRAEIRARWTVLPDGSIGEPVTPDRIIAAVRGLSERREATFAGCGVFGIRPWATPDERSTCGGPDSLEPARGAAGAA